MNPVDPCAPRQTPIVLIHGFPFSQEMWKPQVEALKKEFLVITYDVRGHGKSEVGNGQYTIEFFVDDLIAMLDKLKIQKAVLCGLSMGGYIALRAVERNPERVAGLVLADTRSEADPNEGKIKRASAMKVIEKDKKTFMEGFLQAVFTPGTLQNNKTVVDHIRAIMMANSPLGMRGTLLALAARTDTTAALANIKVPTLILVGEKDTLTPPAASQAMAQKIPGAQLHIIPGAAHLSNLENPEEFNKHLLEFLHGMRIP